MSYWMMVLCPTEINIIDQKGLVDALRAANYRSLCSQYSVDPALIRPTLKKLDLLAPPNFNVANYFVLKYQAERQNPLVIQRLSVDEGSRLQLIQSLIGNNISLVLNTEFNKTRTIFWVELTRSQLGGMGIVLAYEVARWILETYGGILRGLDGSWYRLNAHSAFLVIEV